MTLHEDALAYLLQFLTGVEDEQVLRTFRIAYTADEEKFAHYDLVFVPSGFFESEHYGKAQSIPDKPLYINDIPFLYGSSLVEKRGETLVVHADLPASAFFFLSRYEELCLPQTRDVHGRFPGKASFACRHGLLQRPLAEEYGVLIRNWLRSMGKHIPEPEPKPAKLWITHDLDAPYYCKGLRSVLRETLYGKGFRYAFQVHRGVMEDPYDTYAWMFETEEKHLQHLSYPHQRVYFIKGGGCDVYDKPHYKLTNKHVKRLMHRLDAQKTTFGLHGSYSAEKDGSLPEEKKRLEDFLRHKLGKQRNKVFLFRSHYLRSCEPKSFHELEKAGITDDFSMGYADVAGFRLGTCRPVVWIDPMRGLLSRLVLHPLTVMDNTLYKQDYMNLSEEQAKECCARLFEATCRHGGEICLLWHNSALSEFYPTPAVPWVRSIYEYVLAYLENMNR